MYKKNLKLTKRKYTDKLGIDKTRCYLVFPIFCFLKNTKKKNNISSFQKIKKKNILKIKKKIKKTWN